MTDWVLFIHKLFKIKEVQIKVQRQCSRYSSVYVSQWKQSLSKRYGTPVPTKFILGKLTEELLFYPPFSSHLFWVSQVPNFLTPQGLPSNTEQQDKGELSSVKFWYTMDLKVYRFNSLVWWFVFQDQELILLESVQSFPHTSPYKGLLPPFFGSWLNRVYRCFYPKRPKTSWRGVEI